MTILLNKCATVNNAKYRPSVTKLTIYFYEIEGVGVHKNRCFFLLLALEIWEN